MSTETGTKFEKYVQMLLSINGIDAERNIMYHKGRKKRQVDLESRSGLIFPKRTIYECKYTSNSLDFLDNYVQLMETLLFTKAHEGILVTNAQVAQRQLKERQWKIKIYDQNVLLGLRPDNRGDIGAQVRRMEQEIMGIPYLQDDHQFIHKNV